jgi:hypothetical protein
MKCSRLGTVLVLLAAGVLTAWSHASNYTETFDTLNITGSSQVTGSCAVSGGTFLSTGATPYINLATERFPNIGSNKGLQVLGFTKERLYFFDYIPLSSDTVIQFAVPIKVIGLTPGFSSVDILQVDLGSGQPYFSLAVDSGVLRTTVANGWPGSSAPISRDAFCMASSTNWFTSEGCRWHLLAFRVFPSTVPGAAHYDAYDINPVNGHAILLQSYSGSTNGTVNPVMIRFSTGMCVNSVPTGDFNTRILLDDVTFWSDTFATNHDFLSAVASKYNVTLTTPVELADFSIE